MRPKAATVNEYISGFEGDVKKRLLEIRNAIRKAAPKAEEVISYGIAGYKYFGMLIFFAGFKNHISVYPVTAGMKKYQKEIDKYQTSKGTLQFPHDKPVPYKFISKLTTIRLKENEEKADLKKKKVSVKK